MSSREAVLTTMMGCKRLLAPYADLLVSEPMAKKGRHDVMMTTGSDDESTHGVNMSPRFVGGGESRQRSQIEDFQELFAEQPAEKRFRTMEPAGPSQSSDGSSDMPLSREAIRRGVATHLVQALQGCQSVEEAVRKVEDALTTFEGEVQQNTLKEVEVAAEGTAENVQSLQHTKKILMRAVHHLAQRCRQAESTAAETEGVKVELERCREGARRLAHQNDLLQCHLRLHLDSVR
mmetsp:Transcript_61136/g.133902  ORF Transcript_61136/g.133902 Transcript_61136/m.133902 type:complete len:234 (-) Transcript_61136:408-1109(-)|eukprot:CAMPEP_0206529986 /NCGR_PEP_ID=MMETSP0325_2-20121206/2906_1 /ASSEMBLY_ACC=CAM_ASM_000347 /TAXON_ID=2866 /ORGANISM="Crypthecodinium cohnii, Strain Seligo" /LENGTH=233 /DNA_ID=CAMNT_0054025963 /DNA_START=133 /DNA_END=834 /DNA_ORIENTATION=+